MRRTNKQRGYSKSVDNSSNNNHNNNCISSNHLYGPVTAIAISCYLNGLNGDLVHDDIPAVQQNRDVLGLTPIHEVFINDFWGTNMGDPSSHKSYRPLTVLTFRANYVLSGLEPFWFHACNVALHAAASLLFTRVCLAVAGLRPHFAATAGALFAAHPIHTEAVTGVVGRADVLACVLFLLSFLAYHGQPALEGRGPCRTTALGLWLSVLLGGLAMLAKETGITVMLVNLLYDLYRSWPCVKRAFVELRWNEETLQFTRRAARVLISLCLLLAIRLALLQGSLPRFSIQDNPTAFHPSRQVRFLTFCYLAAFNCWLLLCPWALSHDWQMGSVPLVTSWADTRNLATLLLFASCLALAYRGICDLEQQRHSPLLLGGLLLLLPFLPAANLLLTVGFVVAERVLFIPSLGCLLLVAYGAQLAWSSLVRQRWLLLCGGLLLLVVFCSRTVVRNRDWSSRETLSRAGLKTLPHNAKMHYNLANFLRDTDKQDLAVYHYQEALRLWPAYASAHNNLGTLMSAPDQAEGHFLEAIRHSPNHVNAHYNLGQVYRRENRTAEAVRMLRRCIVLVQLYSSMGRSSAVGSLLRHITRVQPGHPEHLAEYARWLHRSGREWESFGFYQRALTVSPRHVSALVGSARALRSRGHHARARIFLQRALVVQKEVYGSSAWHRAISEPTLHINPHLYALQQEKSAEHEKPVAINCHKVSCARRLLGAGVQRAGLLNRTRDAPGCLQPCSSPAAPTEELVPASTTPDLGVFSAAHSTGTAAFNQGYHYSHWSPQVHLHAVVAPVEPTLLALPGPEVIQGSCVTGDCTGFEDEITG